MRVLLGLLLTTRTLVSQSNLEWRGDISLRYFSRNPFLGDTDSWRYVQGIADFSLSGHVWDPRFFQFDLGGSFNYTDNGGSAGIHDWRYLGYRIETRFFPQKKVSFGFRYFRNDSGTTRTALEPSPLKYALQEKGIDLSLSRIKHLPCIRVAYLSRSYRSSVSDSPRNEQDSRLDLGVSQTADLLQWMLDNWSRDGVFIWDLVAAVQATDPAVCPEAQMALEVITAPGPEQGSTKIVEQHPNVSICLDPAPESIKSLSASVFQQP